MAHWYLGASPPIPSNLAWEALGVLERLLPEKIDTLLASGGKGPAIIAPLIDLGFTLKACENLVGFDNVLVRMKQGENAAFSEAHVAAALVKLRYSPELEPHLKGKRLDAVVFVQGEKVYVEVKTPNQSDVTKQTYAAMTALANRLVEQNPGTSVDVYLLVDATSDVADTILSLIECLTPPASDIVHELPSIGYVRYGAFRSDLTAFEPTPNDERLPVLGVASLATRGAVSTRVNVKCRLPDYRAERLMSEAASQFSCEETNLLIMDIPHVQSGIRDWAPIIQRRFQPTRNRRFGAVVLLDKVTYNAVVRRRWLVLRNPHAYRPPPQKLLVDVASLDESVQLND